MNKEEELRHELSWFIRDQTQLGKTFRHDVDEVKDMQQEHMSKLDIHSILPSFDELIQQQINKYYHYKRSEDEDDDDDDDNDNEDYCDKEQKLISKFDKLHEENILWFKEKKKGIKMTGSVIERFRMSHYE